MVPLSPRALQNIVMLSLSMVAGMVSVELIVPSGSLGLLTSILRAKASGESFPSPLTTHSITIPMPMHWKAAVVFRVALTDSGATRITVRVRVESTCTSR